jgi:hypothetical protein
MNAVRTLLSSFLLLTYALGIAHDLIPHCHTDQAASHADGHHGHEHLTVEHHQEEGTAHQHIVHQNHLDEGLFGLMSCLLSELDHPLSSSNQECLPENSNVPSFKSEATVSILMLAQVENYCFELTQQFILPTPDRQRYCTPLSSSSSRRGPPVLS